MEKEFLNKVTIAMVDNGLNTGDFTYGLLEAVTQSNVPFSSILRHKSPFVGKNRARLLHDWLNIGDTQWLLWVDSDIVLTKDIVEKIWNAANPETAPIVSGLYFYPAFDIDGRTFKTKACMYNLTDDPHYGYYLDDYPKDELFKVEAVGFGCLLMHRSAIEKLIEKEGYFDYFATNAFSKMPVETEDFNFCTYLLKNEIPVYVHTGAIPDHVKSIRFTEEFKNITDSYVKEK